MGRCFTLGSFGSIILASTMQQLVGQQCVCGTRVSQVEVLMRYILACISYLSKLPATVKKLTCYSDSCFGQNKNFEMICFWNHQALTRFEQIDHKFLVRGHTYLPNDRDFAHIEKRKDILTLCMFQVTGRTLYARHVPKKHI